MTNYLTNTFRRLLSLSAFAVLLAAFSLAFAEAAPKQRHLEMNQARPANQLKAPTSVKLNAAATSKQGGLSGTLNLNTASELELVKLPGVGPKKAARIVAWRVKHGTFRRVVDLRRVKGFGAKSVKKLRPYLTVKGANTLE